MLSRPCTHALYLHTFSAKKSSLLSNTITMRCSISKPVHIYWSQHVDVASSAAALTCAAMGGHGRRLNPDCFSLPLAKLLLFGQAPLHSSHRFSCDITSPSPSPPKTSNSADKRGHGRHGGRCQPDAVWRSCHWDRVHRELHLRVSGQPIAVQVHAAGRCDGGLGPGRCRRELHRCVLCLGPPRPSLLFMKSGVDTRGINAELS